MTTPHTGHTATLLPDGRVLVAGGYGAVPYKAGAELYDPSTDRWTATGSMNVGRQDHTATLLVDGRVLVVGGYNSNAGGFLASAEVYDPGTGQWTLTGDLPAGRELHTATLLHDGRVLVTGGYGEWLSLDTAELYDPASGQWAVVSSMSEARRSHTATLLADGRVLVAGGYRWDGDAVYPRSAELFDPATGLWTTTGSLWHGRFYHTATLLLDGQVLVAGGMLEMGPSDSEVYDPSTGSWTTADDLSSHHQRHTATLLPDGRVLLLGGRELDFYDARALVYEPETRMWTLVRRAGVPRAEHTATLLTDGRVLVTGGENEFGALNSAEIYGPVAGGWTPTGSMNEARYDHGATLLPDGQVLVSGGRYSSYVGDVWASAELYERSTGAWTYTGSLNAARGAHTATLLDGGTVLVAGGSGVWTGWPDWYLTSSELYDPTQGQWTPTGSLGLGRRDHTATLLADGRVLVAGGYNGLAEPPYLASAEVYDPTTGKWSATGSLNIGRIWHTATLLPDGHVLVVGGLDYSAEGDQHLSSVEIYDPSAGQWTPTAGLNLGRHDHSATLLVDGRVLVSGGYNGQVGPAGMLSSAEVFDPATEQWTTTGSLHVWHDRHTATLLPDGGVLVAGGTTWDLFSAEVYNTACGFWMNTSGLNGARREHTTTLLPDGWVLAAGGHDEFGMLATAELHEPIARNNCSRGYLPLVVRRAP